MVGKKIKLSSLVASAFILAGAVVLSTVALKESIAVEAKPGGNTPATPTDDNGQFTYVINASSLSSGNNRVTVNTVLNNFSVTFDSNNIPNYKNRDGVKQETNQYFILENPEVSLNSVTFTTTGKSFGMNASVGSFSSKVWNKPASSSVSLVKFTSTDASYWNSISIKYAYLFESISVGSLPSQTTYQVGDSLNTNGLSILGGNIDVTDNCTFSPSTFTQTGLQTVTVKHTGSNFTTSFQVNVTNGITPATSITLENDIETFGGVGHSIKYTVSPSDATSTFAWSIVDGSDDCIILNQDGSYTCKDVQEESICTVRVQSTDNPNVCAEMIIIVYPASYGATDYAQNIFNYIFFDNDVCDPNGQNSNLDSISSFWEAVREEYEETDYNSAYIHSIIASKEAVKDSADAIEKMLYQYDYIYAKYGSQLSLSNFLGREIAMRSFLGISLETSDTTTAVLVILGAAMMTLGGAIFYKKARKVEE